MQNDRPILLLALGETLIWAAIFYVFPALLLRWEQDLGWSKADITGAITLAILASAFVAPVAGWLIDKGHGAAMMGGTAAVGGLGLCLLSMVTAQWHFYCVWIMMGVAMAGCLYEPCFAIVTRAHGARAKRGIIRITLAAGFASTLSFPTYYALSETVGWRASVLLVGIGVVLLVAPLLWHGARQLEHMRRLHNTGAPQGAKVDRSFLSNPAFWCLALGFAMIAITHGATIQHLLPILDDRGIRPETAVFAASLIGPMQVAGRLAMMALGNRVSNRAVALAAFVFHTAAIVFLMFAGTSVAFLCAFIILLGSAVGTVSILRPVLARDVLGDADFGTKSSALAIPFFVGVAISPFLGSVLWGWGGYDLMLMVMVGLGAFGGLIYAQTDRFSRTKSQTAT